MKITRKNLSELVAEVIREEEDYQKYFQAMLKKHGVSSPADFKTDAEKKAFFNDVDKNWKGVSERISKMKEVADSDVAPQSTGDVVTPKKEVEAMPNNMAEPMASDTLESEIKALKEIGAQIDSALENLHSIKEKWVKENKVWERKRMRELEMKKESLMQRKEAAEKQLAVKETNDKIAAAIEALQGLKQPVMEGIRKFVRKRK